ncbi:hypothetical protein SODALDRAFT_341750 [Sodiomyces alkalinus F11]|uniref:Rhodopsin domain-containing protein n=1 Tax=Sodiomyces alkalinus (strain CBS 110278 / VKM F-3762 / F11) TaxID=1314773 RepID=A0A3N2Q664_SODAK|nr:hypothetical protein SODALDRAFT_341750 [Sodiomyces alkalinus F11]ROT42261.1 hypothetical protein SODALDRAFT_341750 [Sodiomyces alkalinus F11]
MDSLDLSSIDIYNTPVVPPPEGVTPDFDPSWTQVQVATIIVFGVTYSLATATQVLRYITSTFIVKALELDVVLVTLSWLTSLGYFISVAMCMHHGWGRHAWNVSIAEAANYNNYLLPITITYIWCPTLAKLAILSVLHRISNSLWFRGFLYFIVLTLVAYTTTFTGLLAGTCNPRELGSGICLNNIAIAQVALNIWSDVAIILLPIPTILRLHLPLRQRLVIAGILTLGSAVLITSIVRAPYIQILAESPDFSLKQAEAGVWSIVELNLGIVCANLMRMKPFLRRYLPVFLEKLGFSLGKSRVRMNGKHSHSFQLHSIEAPRLQDGASRDCVAGVQGVQRDDGSTESILRR